ncbi:MAG: isoaspartyl peptidase/L-asparaginase [Anaerolineae bacterium]|nr:isoaspartyl peptidase/L-asparaginase [Anaerolineae bacterium]
MAKTILVSSEGKYGIEAGVEVLRGGAARLDVIEAAIRPVEIAPECRSVGLGGWPNLTGAAELDASIMDGRTLHSGSVGALSGFRHPISVARQVMERLPHVLLVGAGAARFATEIGAEPGPTDDQAAAVALARQGWETWLTAHVPAEVRADWPDVPLIEWARQSADPETAHGTTIALVKDAAGEIGCGVSTCGWAYKYPGRLGDSPIIGAGVYADSRYGAAGCTGMGELTIRTGTARAVVLYMKMGLSVEAACREALADLRAAERRFKGGVTIHAIDAAGQPCVLSVGRFTDTVRWYFWTEGMPAFEERQTLVAGW